LPLCEAPRILLGSGEASRKEIDATELLWHSDLGGGNTARERGERRSSGGEVQGGEELRGIFYRAEREGYGTAKVVGESSIGSSINGGGAVLGEEGGETAHRCSTKH
jgi:hypothetical protein